MANTEDSMKWLPIESAPKGEDGDWRGPNILVCDAEEWVGEVFWKVRRYGDKKKPGWMIANCDEEHGYYIDATHWMPLPSPVVSNG